MTYKIKQTTDNKQKSLAVELVMRALPDWFYIEEVIKKYKEEVKETDFFIAYNQNDQVIGMMSLIEFDNSEIESVEIKVIGVLKEYHHQKIGYALIKEAENFAKQKGKKYLTVKTLASQKPDVFYQKTREFYQKCGFINLMNIKELWDKDNPCLLMLKDLTK